MCSCICLEWYQNNTTWLKDPGVILHHVVIAQMLKYQNHSSDWMRPEAILDGGKIGNRSASKGFDMVFQRSKFPREDLVKIWLRLDTWTPAARRLEGQALYGAGLGAAPTVESLGRSLQVLKTRWTSRCIGVSNMVTWSTHWIHQVLTSWLLSCDDDLLRLQWWLGFGVQGLVFGCQNCTCSVDIFQLKGGLSHSRNERPADGSAPADVSLF